jgi:hypothetical protein
VPGKFGGKVLRVGCAASVAEEQDFVPVAQGVSHGHSRAGQGFQISGIFEKRSHQVKVIGDAGSDQ